MLRRFSSTTSSKLFTARKSVVARRRTLGSMRNAKLSRDIASVSNSFAALTVDASGPIELDRPALAPTSPAFPEYTFVDTTEDLQEVLRVIKSAQTVLDARKVNPHTPLLYVDLEGNDLCRFGTVSLLQIHIPAVKRTFIIDVFALGERTFSTSILSPESIESTSYPPSPTSDRTSSADSPSESLVTLKHILESPQIIKCFFDVRNDADALFNIYDISMVSVTDVQILEIATRRGNKRLLNGLARSIRTDAGLGPDVLAAWLDVKARGKALFNSSDHPPRGTVDTSEAAQPNFAIFDERPLPRELLEYSINDVIHLPRLWAIYDAKLDYKWRAKTENEAVWRLQLARQAMYYGKNGNMALGPF